MDSLYIGTPFFFPAHSLLLQDIVPKLQAYLEHRCGGKQESSVSLTSSESGVSLAGKSSSMQYCLVMDLVRSLVRWHGLEGAIAVYHTFSPLDYFSWKRCAVVERPMTKPLAVVFEKISLRSTAVNMFWSFGALSLVRRGSECSCDPIGWTELSTPGGGGVAAARISARISSCSAWIFSVSDRPRSPRDPLAGDGTGSNGVLGGINGSLWISVSITSSSVSMTSS